MADLALAVPRRIRNTPRRILRFPLRHAFLLAAALLVSHLALIVFLPSGAQAALLRRAIFPIESLVAAIGLIYGARASAPHSRRIYLAWSILALAQATAALGDALRFCSWAVDRLLPLSFVPDGLFVLYYLIFVAGILHFPFWPRTSRAEGLRLFLDVGIVLLGLALLAWNFLAGPLLASGQPRSDVLLALVRPAGDLVLILALLMLLLRPVARQRHLPLLVLSAGTLILLLTHAVDAYRSLLGTAVSQGVLEMGWGTGVVLSGLAGAVQAAMPPVPDEGSTGQRLLTPWQLYLPYTSLAVAYLLLMWRHGHPALMSFHGLAIGVASIIGLMLVRQVVALRENVRLQREWRQVHDELQQRVEERTAALEHMNQDLHAEMQSNAHLYLSLQKTNQELCAAMGAKDEMLQNASHELRTPLMLILGYVELISNGEMGSLDARQAQALGIVLRQAERLRFMVNRLLTLQTFEADKICLAPFDAGHWLGDLVDDWRVRAMQGGVSLAADINHPLPLLTADRDLFGQVMENLLDNAVKFTPQGGQITVSAWSQAGEFLVSVEDSGVGIPPDKLDQVFERFYQVDGSPTRRFGGLGIGLALCRAIVDAHHGCIWAQSKGNDLGTTFYLSLPLAPH